jgi:hypothetical protein
MVCAGGWTSFFSVGGLVECFDGTKDGIITWICGNVQVVVHSILN